MSDYLKELLKIGTSIDHQFIDEFYDILTNPEDKFSVNLDTIVAWLKLDRKEFVRNLKRSNRLVENQDYIIEKSKYTGMGHNRQDIWLTKRAFKIVCMYTKSKNGDRVREYFIELENFLDRNKYIIIDHMNEALKKANVVIKQLQLNQTQRSKYPEGGYVYVYESMNTTGKVVYRIGMAKDMNGRLSNHNSSNPDELKIVAIIRTEDPESVEACLHGILKMKKYRPDKSFYHDITLPQIKKLLSTCQDMTFIYKHGS